MWARKDFAMPTGMITLLDIAKKNGSDRTVGLIEETVVATPELQLGAARTIKGISYPVLVRNSVPKGGFRSANEGTERVKSEYVNKTFEAMIFNPQWAMDKAVAMADEDGPAAAMAREAQGIMLGSMIHLAMQFYYGVNNDAKGFPGLEAQYDLTGMTLDAEGAGGRSVWAVKFGPQHVQWLWAQDGTGLVVTPEREQTLYDANGKPYTGILQEINTRVGLQLGSRHSAARIANLDGTTGHTLNDDLMFDLLAKFPADVRPDMFLMNTKSLNELRKSRTATNATGTPAPLPTEVGNIPIMLTEALKDNEPAVT
ncbi:hypothetical protein A6X21_14495 [Planctopirus hydrillae]|uniref:Phage capsid protein n=2 Tax=Planctopirus hydrillae TaxID=1841610 RepID=A0A1C3E4A9_9PLAN|nr:hypothetical protein A6X21_14495 [Planctopirus hydrillae]